MAHISRFGPPARRPDAWGLATSGQSATKRRLNASPPSPAPAESPNPSAQKPQVHGITGWRRAALWPLGLLLRTWGATLRVEPCGDSEKWLRKTDEPVAFVLWHNRLFIVSEIFRRYRDGRPIYGLVSASRDGAWLAAFFSLVGIRSVRGSSSRLGREAVTALVDVVRAGNDIGITPDGPRGPRYDFKAGALIVSRRTQMPILLLGAAYESAWQLKSWDGFYLPKPFSRVRVYCTLISADQLTDRERSAETLRQQLLAMNPDSEAITERERA